MTALGLSIRRVSPQKRSNEGRQREGKKGATRNERGRGIRMKEKLKCMKRKTLTLGMNRTKKMFSRYFLEWRNCAGESLGSFDRLCIAMTVNCLSCKSTMESRLQEVSFKSVTPTPQLNPCSTTLSLLLQFRRCHLACYG